MSSPDHPEAGEERRLTVIVVPHGDLETRSFVVSYAKLKILTVSAVCLLLLLAISLAFLFPIMAQAARVPGLERDLEELEEQRARVVELAQTLQEVEAQYERVRQMLGADALLDGDSVPLLPPLRGDSAPADPDTVDLTTLVGLWPLATAGYVTRALSDGRTEHPGLDIAVAQNSYIRAAGDGTVRVAGVDEVYGQYVVIDHGSRLESVYGHANRIFVTAGERVQRGEVIALSGSTGRSAAPHLHFEIRVDGKAVDPFGFVRQP